MERLILSITVAEKIGVVPIPLSLLVSLTFFKMGLEVQYVYSAYTIQGLHNVFFHMLVTRGKVSEKIERR